MYPFWFTQAEVHALFCAVCFGIYNKIEIFLAVHDMMNNLIFP